MADKKKDELVRLLEERAFKPILNARSKGAEDMALRRTA